MNNSVSKFMKSLEERTAEILDACTRCGKCTRVCPMLGPAGLDASDAKGIAAGVLEILKAGEDSEAAVLWAESCTGSGRCVAACEDGINPRFMLALARAVLHRERGGPEAVQACSAELFRGMTRGVSILSRLQLAPELLQRLGQLREPEDEPEAPDVLLYTGCNVLKTPHIALLCLDVLDALAVSYRVAGGPSYCCGVFQFQAGDTEGFGRMSYRTIGRLSGAGAGEVLSWCPSCHVQLGDVALPSYERTEGTPFELTPFVIYLERRLEDLKSLLGNRVEKRVGMHEHPGVPGITEATRRILEAIPGLEFVDLAQPRVGYMCTTLNALPEYKRDIHAAQLAAAEAAGVDTLAGVYHACHRDLCSHERDWPFEVVNFLELVGESMGVERADIFKRLKIMQDVDAILADSTDMIVDYGLDPEEVREVVLKDILGEQTLPLGRPA
ncbi:MAG: (Fe-S)-binding protein [Alphaproteobacteria bacterium]|jgi:Fe-S oxidoreductase|nr:(Fe-S)-binding protein [Alphaproteobacteria bacterium]